jgi:hypothetical protein
MVCNKFFVRGDQVTAMEQKYEWPKKLFYRGLYSKKLILTNYCHMHTTGIFTKQNAPL